MPKSEFYIQCQLKRGTTQQVSWLPEKYAIKGKFLELKENDKWENGWEVMSLGNKIDGEFLIKVLHMSHKRTREASDV